MNKRKKALIIIYLLALVSLILVIYTIPSVTGFLTKTEILQYGSLQVTDEATCYIVRDETVYLAGSSGTINYYVSQDTSVRNGSKVLEVLSDSAAQGTTSSYAGIISELGAAAVQTNTYQAEASGVVSYYADGYEAYFTPDNMRNINYEDVKNMQIQITNLTRSSTLRGEPIYKVCDDNQWYITCWVNAGNISKYEVGNSVTISFPLGEIPAEVIDLNDEGEVWQVVLQTNRYYEEFTMLRKVNAQIITADYSGIIIPNRSITSLDGKVGVYVKSKSGDYVFKEIDVRISDGTNSLATVSSFTNSEGNKVNTVEIYDEILKNPN